LPLALEVSNLTSILFRGGAVLDTQAGILLEGHEVLVENDRIMEVSDRPIRSGDATVVDLQGQTLMPGLIDAHVHIYLSELDLTRLAEIPTSLTVARAAPILRGMLDRGFTSVRDNGGADWGIREAVNSNILAGPRLFIAGRVLSQTGGHGDYRSRTVGSSPAGHCCSGLGMFADVVDGTPAVLQAAREQLRKGADHIKIMISGGVASPYDPLESLQFTEEEIKAAVDSATNWGKYVAAHAYSAPAIRRGVECGVRSIEHGNLVDESTARLMAERGAFVVPTLVTYDSMSRRGRELGLSPSTLEKNKKVLDCGLRSLEIFKSAGVQMGFGSDLLGVLQPDQSREFLLRSEVLSPAEVIRSATTTNARLLGREAELGIIRPGALADMLVVQGNPLEDLEVLQNQGASMPVIIQGGRFVKRGNIAKARSVILPSRVPMPAMT
jgi:imidazolonepropionase-like amidohydrolase